MKNDKFATLEEIRKAYKPLMNKYNLPEFSDLNKLFDIEDIDSETEFFLRRIRKLISERIVNYMRFIEVILNPNLTPLFFFKLIKKLDETDKESLAKIYEQMGKIEIEILSLDLDYSEEKEASFIKEIYLSFKEDINKEIERIIIRLKESEINNKKTTNGSYFG